MKKDKLFICLSVMLCCLIMAATDSIWKPPYAVKSAVKVLLFLLVPLVFSIVRKLSPAALFRPEKKAVLLGAALGIAAFAVILGGYFLLRSFIDFSFIPGSLMENGGINADNFLFVALYIAFCNSLLEEFFFRGFAFLTLKRVAASRFAAVFSAGAFAFYHAGMLDGWFSPILYILTLAALFLCGLFFNYLNARSSRIWTSWLTHMGANLAINTVGMILLGMI